MKKILRFVALTLCLVMMIPTCAFAKSPDVPQDVLEEMLQNIDYGVLSHLGLSHPDQLKLYAYYGEIDGYHMGVFQYGGIVLPATHEIVIRNYEFFFSSIGEEKGFFAYKDGEFIFYDSPEPTNQLLNFINNLSEEEFLKLADAAGASYVFSDVDFDEWYGPAVTFCLNNGYMKGIGNDLFAPGRMVTREQAVQILYNIESADSEIYDGETGFTDVPEGEWYSRAVKWAKEKGVTNGIGNGMFGLGKLLTREQLATLLANYAEIKGYDVTLTGDISAFEDSDAVSDWAEDGVKWSVASGIIKGTDKNYINPKGNATRAQIAQMISNYISYCDSHYTVILNAEGGICDEEIRFVKKGGELGKLPLPEKKGFKFDGWRDNLGNRVTFTTVLTDENAVDGVIELVAAWVTGNKITFITNGGECGIEYIHVESGEALGELPVPTREGYKFLGWQYNDEFVTEETVIESEVDFVLIAAWEEK